MTRLYMVMLREYEVPPEDRRGPPVHIDGSPCLDYRGIPLPHSSHYWSCLDCSGRGTACRCRSGRGTACRCRPLEVWRPFSGRNGFSVYESASSAERQAKVHQTRLRRDTRVVYFDDDHLPTWTSDSDVAATEQEAAMLRAAELAKAAEGGTAPRPLPPPRPKRTRTARSR